MSLLAIENQVFLHPIFFAFYFGQLALLSIFLYFFLYRAFGAGQGGLSKKVFGKNFSFY